MPEPLEGVNTRGALPPPHLLAYQAPAVRARSKTTVLYGAMGMVQFTGAVTRMRKASYRLSDPMLEMSGRFGK